MRIIIEIDPSDLQPSVKVGGNKGQARAEKTENAGEPPEFLVEALHEKEPEPKTAQILDQDAGAGPAWSIDMTEEFFSFPGKTGNGAREEDPP